MATVNISELINALASLDEKELSAVCHEALALKEQARVKMRNEAIAKFKKVWCELEDLGIEIHLIDDFEYADELWLHDLEFV